METRTKAVELETALASSSWVRELAGELVRDPHLVDDLVQDACVIALERCDSVRTSVRGWMRTVMRNLLREGVRKDRRRLVRETRSAGSSETPSAFCVVEKLAVHRQVQDVIVTLKPVYREAVYLRYFEDLTPTRIARVLEIPVSTVKTRLDRALKQMRTALDDANDGDRAAWAVPLAAGVSRWGSPVAGVALAFGAIASVLLLGAVAMTWDDAGSAGPQPDAPVLRTTERVLLAPTAGQGVQRLLAPEPELGHPLPRLPALSPTVGRDVVSGQVFAVGGARRAGVEVKFVPVSGFPSDNICYTSGTVQNLTDLEGFFSVSGITDRGVMLSGSPELRTLFAGRVFRDVAESTPMVVIAPARRFAGRVVDESGRGISGALVALELPPGLRGSLGVLPDAAWELPSRTITGPDGTFTLHAAFVPGGALVAKEFGYQSGRVALMPDLTGPVEIVVKSAHTLEDAVTGLVLDHVGRPVEDALVSDGIEVTRSDDRGRFYLNRAAAGPKPRKLIAVQDGARAALFEPEPDASEWPESIVLRLGPSPLIIRGSVRNSDGSAASGVRVWVMDPTLFSHRYQSSDVVQETRMEGMGTGDDPWVVENLCAGKKRRMWVSVRTDEEGAFQLVGLQDRTYRLAAMRRGAMQVFTLPDVQAGRTDVDWELPESPDSQVITGRCEFPGGAPAAGIRVGVQWDILKLQSIRGRTFSARMHRHRARTGLDGGFVLRGVPAGGVDVFFDGAHALPVHREVVPDASMPLEIVVERRVHLQVIAETLRADAVDFVDDRGRPVHSVLTRRGSQVESRRAKLVRGRSPVLAVPSGVARVLLYSAGRPVGDVPVSPVPGRLNVVRL